MARIGLVSSLDPVCRLICLALLSSASLFSSVVFAAVLASAAASILLLEGIGLSTILRDLTFVSLFALFSTALRLIGLSVEPLLIINESFKYWMSLLSVFFLGRLFYASTAVSELRDAATRISRRLPFAKQRDIGLGLSMIIGFIPFIFDEWRFSLEVAHSRGMRRKPRLSTLALFVTAFLRRLMLRAVATPEALIARGWTQNRGTSPSRWKLRDTRTLIGCIAIAMASLLRLV